MYGSYAALFVYFAFEKYLWKPLTKKKADKAD
jgi:hypothetical protein